MEWINVKLKAGRIIPALATTTACIAGLQTIELCKVLADSKVEDLRNAFLSLAIPIIRLSEPGPPPISKLTDNLKVTIWDRWDIKKEKPSQISILQIFENLEQNHKLKPKDLFHKSTPVYLYNLMNLNGREAERQEI